MAQTTIQGTFLGDGTVTGAKIGADFISAQTALTSGLATTDEIIVSDAGVIKRMDISVLALSAAQLTSGTIPDARFPATLPAISGANLTNLPASGVALNGSTDNTLVTVTSANNIAGESTLTYDASGNTNVLELTNAGSASNNHARIKISATHASGGDPVVEWRTADTNSWSIGTDHSDDDNFYLMSNSQPGQGTNTIVMKVDRVTGSGSGANACSQHPQITKPMQSCGMVRVTSDTNSGTGNGNLSQLSFGTVVEDQNADWSTSNNNTFYAPVTGQYFFHVRLSLMNLSTNTTEIYVHFNTDYSSRAYNVVNQGGIPDGLQSGAYVVQGSSMVKLEEGDYLNVRMRISGHGADNVVIEGGGSGMASALSWCLLA